MVYNSCKNKVLKLLFYTFSLVFLLSSCGLKYESIPSLESRRKDREKAIESYVNLYVKQDKSYESLAFGPLTVYKPEEFHRLDSLYEIRFKYEEEGRMNEFAATGMPDQIEKQIEIAEGAKDKITYEMEHIYSLQKGKDLSIFHDYFMLTENDSISIHDPFYSYQIPLSLKEMQLNYLFELHFLTPSERYILDEELNFILFFKQREQELIESERDLSTFMSHTLSLMEIARLTGSLDFVDLTKAIANRYIKSRYQSTVVEYFGPLIVKEDDNGQVEEYRLLVQFRAVLDDEEVQMRSELNFSRYLVPTNIFDEKL